MYLCWRTHLANKFSFWSKKKIQSRWVNSWDSLCSAAHLLLFSSLIVAVCFSAWSGILLYELFSIGLNSIFFILFFKIKESFLCSIFLFALFNTARHQMCLAFPRFKILPRVRSNRVVSCSVDEMITEAPPCWRREHPQLEHLSMQRMGSHTGKARAVKNLSGSRNQGVRHLFLKGTALCGPRECAFLFMWWIWGSEMCAYI